jgi:hypothetical protein
MNGSSSLPSPGATATPVFTPDATKSQDDLAEVEAAKISAGEDLEHDSKRQEHVRHQKLHNHVNWGTLALFWVIVFCVGGAAVVLAWHLVAPACLQWLSDSGRDKLEGMLTAALLSNALAGYVKRRLS